MRTVHVRVYAQLGDFLPHARRGRAFAHRLRRPTSVKDLVESLGPPHPEVELVLVDGAAVGFGHLVQGGERAAVFPHFTELVPEGLVRASPPLLRDGRFLLDGHLGRLAAHMRLCGLDAAHEHDADDAALARQSAALRRTLLTRDLGLLKRSVVVHGAYVRSVRPRDQLLEVVRRFGLAGALRPFSRCLACNTQLADASPGAVARRVPARVRRDHHAYRGCPGCGRVYWRGSHFERMQRFVEWVQESLARPPA
jgi:uncharacterized protein